MNSLKRPYHLLFLILLLAFGLRLAGLNSQSLWWDELKTVQRAAMSFPELLTDLAGHRAHLPLYFGLMQLWQWFGESSFVVRYFSVIWGVVGVTAVYQLGRQVANNHVGLLAALLLAISPFHIWYSQEARMYSFLPALIILAHCALIAALQNKKLFPWLLYGLLMAVAVATHYFALFVVMAHYIFFVLHFRQLRPQAIRWFQTMLMVVIILLPLGWFVLSGRSGDTVATVPPWIATIQWADLLLTVWNFSVGPGIGLGHWIGYVGTAVFLLTFIAASQLTRLRKTDQTIYPPLLARLLFIWFALPIGLTFFVSLNWPFLPNNPFSLYLDRYLIISLPPFLLLVSWEIEKIATMENAKTAEASLAAAKKYLRPFFIILALAVSSLSIWQLMHNPDHWRNDWRTAVSLISQEPTSSIVVLGQQDVVLPLEYYGHEQIRFVQLPPPDGEIISEAYIASISQQIETAVQQSPTAWHIEPYYNHDTHQFPEARQNLLADESHSMAQTWLKNNFTVLEQHQLPGLRLTLYDLEIETKQ